MGRYCFHRILLIFVALMLSGSIMVKADGHEKLSFGIQQLRADYQTRRAISPCGEESVCAFVRLKSSHAEDVLSVYGCTVVTQINDIFIVQIPMEQIDVLANHEDVVRIEAQFDASPLLDVTPSWVHNLPVYTGTGLPQAFDGTGVLLGIVDGGFDLTHPSFYGVDGSTYRIKGFVDDYASDDESVGTPTLLGREYDSEEEIMSKAHSGDTDTSHGTHCLGIAAGSGYGSEYKGIAYGADIFAVSTKIGTESYYSSATEVARMKRIFDYADETGQPCVITYSIGFNDIPDDSQLFVEALEGLTGEGRIIVTSAGNEGRKLSYVRKPVGIESAGSTLSTKENRGRVYFLSDQPFKLKCISLAIEENEYCKSDSVVYDTEDLPTDSLVLWGHHLIVERWGTYYTLTDRTEGRTAVDHYLALIVEGDDADVQMYADQQYSFSNTYGTQMNDLRLTKADHTHCIGLPGTLSQMITVGALNGRYSYTALDGSEVKSTGSEAEVGVIASFSSIGPTKDGRVKPDVVAPGVSVLSAGNSYYSGDYGKTLVKETMFKDRTYPWVAMSGTSMATPCTAGIIALWLQADPTLTPARVKEVLKNTCKHVVDGIDYPNNVYGSGLIDAYAGILDILGIPSSIDRVSKHQPTVLQIRPTADRQVCLSFDAIPAPPLTVRVYTVSGQLVTEQVIAPTSTTYLLSIPQVRQGVYVVQVDSAERGVAGSELIRF